MALNCPKVLIARENSEAYDFDDLFEHPERLLLQGEFQTIINDIVRDCDWKMKWNSIVKKKKIASPTKEQSKSPTKELSMFDK
jgi:hypothetical protein